MFIPKETVDSGAVDDLSELKVPFERNNKVAKCVISPGHVEIVNSFAY